MYNSITERAFLNMWEYTLPDEHTHILICIYMNLYVRVINCFQKIGIKLYKLLRNLFFPLYLSREFSHIVNSFPQYSFQRLRRILLNPTVGQ